MLGLAISTVRLTLAVAVASLLSVPVIWKIRVSPASFASLALKVVVAVSVLVRVTAVPPVCVHTKVVIVPAESVLPEASRVTIASAATLWSTPPKKKKTKKEIMNPAHGVPFALPYGVSSKS